MAKAQDVLEEYARLRAVTEGLREALRTVRDHPIREDDAIFDALSMRDIARVALREET